MVRTKRAYDPVTKSDGYRVLVDRIWPRGISKQSLAVNEWMKDVAPSTELRQWFGHEPTRWKEFTRRYRAELKAGPAKQALSALAGRAAAANLTLVYAARDPVHNNAEVLKAEIERLLG